MTVIISGTDGIEFPNGTEQASAGQVLQVVSATYTTIVTNATQTPVDTGLTATITPKFSTSKILVIVNQNGITNTAVSIGVTLSLMRGATNISNLGSFAMFGLNNPTSGITGQYLDSPATTSATTYKTQIYKSTSTAGTIYAQANSDNSTITLMEIAG